MRAPWLGDDARATTGAVVSTCGVLLTTVRTGPRVGDGSTIETDLREASELVAIDPASGEVRWRSRQAPGEQCATRPVGRELVCTVDLRAVTSSICGYAAARDDHKRCFYGRPPGFHATTGLDVYFRDLRDGSVRSEHHPDLDDLGVLDGDLVTVRSEPAGNGDPAALTLTVTRLDAAAKTLWQRKIPGISDAPAVSPRPLAALATFTSGFLTVGNQKQMHVLDDTGRTVLQPPEPRGLDLGVPDERGTLIAMTPGPAGTAAGASFFDVTARRDLPPVPPIDVVMPGTPATTMRVSAISGSIVSVIGTHTLGPRGGPTITHFVGAVDVRSGRVRWTRRTDVPAFPGPTALPGTSWLVTPNAPGTPVTLRATDIRTGDHAWSVSIPGSAGRHAQTIPLGERFAYLDEGTVTAYG